VADARPAANRATTIKITLIFLSPEIAAEVQRRRHHAADRRHPFVGGFRFLVASPPVRDLLNFAKDLFGAAMSWWQLPLQPGLLGPSCRKRMKAAKIRNNENLARDKQPALPS
jgi:hypothetical protein